MKGTSVAADTWPWAPSDCAFPSDNRQHWRLLCSSEKTEEPQDSRPASHVTAPQVWLQFYLNSRKWPHGERKDTYCVLFHSLCLNDLLLPKKHWFHFFVNCNFLAGRGKHTTAHRWKPADNFQASVFSFYHMDPNNWTQAVGLGGTPLSLTNPSCWPFWPLYF